MEYSSTPQSVWNILYNFNQNEVAYTVYSQSNQSYTDVAFADALCRPEEPNKFQITMRFRTKTDNPVITLAKPFRRFGTIDTSRPESMGKFVALVNKVLDRVEEDFQQCKARFPSQSIAFTSTGLSIGPHDIIFQFNHRARRSITIGDAIFKTISSAIDHLNDIIATVDHIDDNSDNPADKIGDVDDNSDPNLFNNPKAILQLWKTCIIM